MARSSSRGTWTVLLTALALPFVGLSIWLGVCASSDVLSRFASTTLGLSVAIAVFAVNFSFVAFQLAPYRALLAGPSPRHLLAATALVLLALIPLSGVSAGSDAVGRLAVIVVPLLAYGGVLLVALGLREASPTRILGRRASDRALKRFIATFEPMVRSQVQELERLDVDARAERTGDRVPPPMHEISHRVPPPPVDGDPFDACVALAAAAVDRDDAAIFVPTVERLLDLAEILTDAKFADRDGIDGRNVSAAASAHAKVALGRVVRVLALTDGREVLADLFIEALSRYLREAGARRRAAKSWTRDVCSSAAGACRSQLERNTAGAGIIGLLLAIRQVVEGTLREQPDYQEEFSLASYPYAVQAIGEHAVERKDSDIVFRCLETLGWIGCAGVRYGGAEIGRRAASGLVQIGRLARAHELECHWDRCALTPYEHADERLGWMATWIPKTGRPDPWLRIVGTAFSRLRGQHCDLALEDSDPPRLKLSEDRTRSYRESFASEAGRRTLDYSDASMLKDWALH